MDQNIDEIPSTQTQNPCFAILALIALDVKIKASFTVLP